LPNQRHDRRVQLLHSSRHPLTNQISYHAGSADQVKQCDTVTTEGVNVVNAKSIDDDVIARFGQQIAVQ
jgi:hypothetical protein